MVVRKISGYGEVLSLRPCGATSLAEGGKGGRGVGDAAPLHYSAAGVETSGFSIFGMRVRYLASMISKTSSRQ